MDVLDGDEHSQGVVFGYVGFEHHLTITILFRLFYSLTFNLTYISSLILITF